MIAVSDQDKQFLQTLLKNYDRAKFEEIIGKASPVLAKYYSSQPSKLGKRLLDRLFGAWMNKSNEAFVDYWVVNKLVYEYGYPLEQIDLEVPCGALGRQAVSSSPQETHADVVVYSHESRRPGTAIITIECRELGGVNGAKQAASYSRALQSRYHLFTDSAAWEAYKTMPHPLDGLIMGDIPHWVGYKPIARRLSKAHTLPPITDEKQLRDLVKYCHDSIHNEGVDPAKAFDELVKLFFVKVYDEQEIPGEYQFSVLEGESIDATGNHIRELLKQAKEGSKYKELFYEPGDDEFWISNESIRKVVETFQGFSFTGDTLIGIDVKGTVYENMVGSTFRGELGQYFTPRKIVEFMVALLKPTRDDLILDPACGSGGFLIKVLKEVSAQVRIQQKNLSQSRVETIIGQFANNNVYGCDLSPRMVRASRMNMIMHGDGWSGIQRCHGLKLGEHPFFKDKSGKFTLILSNPPFAGFEEDGNILAKFDVGKNKAGRIRGVNRAIVFVEQIINLLKEDGRAGIVLPRSIFENESYSFKKIRELIYRKCQIIALIGLPRTAFHHTDCGILGDLLFIKKCSKPPEDYGVFVARAKEVGYNTLGHNIDQNDLIPILKDYDNNSKTSIISIKKLMAEDNLNPWHYDPSVRALKKIIERQSDLVPYNKNTSKQGYL